MTKTENQPLPDPQTVIAEKVLDHPFYTEGPVVDGHGNLFFTDIAGKHIRQLVNQEAKAWATGARPNGQAIFNKGEHLVCDSDASCILHFTASGKLKARRSSGRIGDIQVRCPNDIVVDPEHGFYFTDSVRHTGAVFYEGFDGTQSVIAKNIDFANGIVLTADKKHLLIAESYQNRILELELAGPGQAKGIPRVFADLPAHPNGEITSNLPDGLALDTAGRLWVAHYGMQALQVLSPSGVYLTAYNTGIPLTSNLCFNRPFIYVTGGIAEPGPGLITRLEAGIEGLNLI